MYQFCERGYVFLRGLDLSKEVLWISVKNAAKLQAVKVRGFKKILLLSRPRTAQM